MREAHRIANIDALRGVSILMVIAYHVGTHFPATIKDPVAVAMERIGWAGVDLFFAISGFLITRILVSDSGWEHLRGFFVKRFFRIVPIYMIALVVYALASITTGFDRELLGRLWVNAALLTAWLIPFMEVPYTLTWSVSVEETAYLSFAILSIVGLARFRYVLAAIVVLALLLRIWLVGAGVFETWAVYFFPPSRLDTIAFGGLVALMPTVVAPKGRNLAIVTAGVIAIFAVFGVTTNLNPWTATIGYTVMGLLSALFVGQLAQVSLRRGQWLIAGLARVGQVSYFIYLFHLFAVKLFSYVLPKGIALGLGYWPLFLLISGATFVAAVISWRLFEFPLIQLGRRLATRPAADVVRPDACESAQDARS